MALAPISASNPAQAAFGLEFQSLLRIILTQLTYQDPLKPIDNFQFVSQLGQFAQLQQSQALNDQMADLLATQGNVLALGLLGKTVDANLGQATVSGEVEALSFATGEPAATIRTADGQTLSGISLANITQVR
jgi:flagellar basal-body rod modification protein FlgD